MKTILKYSIAAFLLIISILSQGCGGESSKNTTPTNSIIIPVYADLGADISTSSETQITLKQIAINPSSTTYVFEQILGTSVSYVINSDLSSISFITKKTSLGETLAFQVKAISPDKISTSVDTIIITVAGIGLPSADAGADQVVSSGANVSIGTTSITATNYSYLWHQISGRSVSLSSSTSSRPSFIAPSTSATEQLVFRLTVTTLAGAVSTDDVQITVHSTSTPIINVDSHLIVTSTDTVNLNALGTYPSGTTFNWIQTSGVYTPTIINNNTASASFVAPFTSTIENYSFELTITSPWKTTSKASVTVQVRSLDYPIALNLNKILAPSLYSDSVVQNFQFSATQRTRTLLSYKIIRHPSKGFAKIIDASTGLFSYTKNNTEQGVDEIIYSVKNVRTGIETQATFTLTYNQYDLILPTSIYAVEGFPLNIYLDNLVLDINPIDATPIARSYRFSFTSDLTGSDVLTNEKWSYTPNAMDVGIKNLTIKLIDSTSNNIIATKSARINVAEFIPDLTKIPTSNKILMIGDSITAQGSTAKRLSELFSRDNHPSLKFLGKVSFPPDSYRVEAYGGNGWERFASYDSVSNGIDYSPFYYSDTNTLQFDRYLSENLQPDTPNLVTIQLGTNDIFWTINGYGGILKTLNEIIYPSADKLISTIQASIPNVKILIAVSPPPNILNNPFYENFGNAYSRWRFKLLHHGMIKNMLERYSNRQSENIYVSYPGLHLSPITGFDNTISGGVHPNASGHVELGNAFYAWIRTALK